MSMFEEVNPFILFRADRRYRSENASAGITFLTLLRLYVHRKTVVCNPVAPLSIVH